MFKQRKVALIATAAVAITALLGGCGGSQSADNGSSGGDEVSIVFWAAPNPPQEKFWNTMAEKYMEEHPNVKIEVSAIPESPSSEAGILTALSSGTKLTASENVFVGFGSQLVNSEQVVPLDEMPGYDELVSSRQMKELMEGWKFSDGHQYIFPLYVNPMLYSWRMDLLQELGYTQPPRTYSEVIEAGEKLKAAHPDKYLWARKELVDPEKWWERWYDFFAFYYAASDGQAFLTDNEVTADRDAAVGVAKFIKDLNDKGLLLTDEATNPFETGLTMWAVQGPWVLPTWSEQFPELKVGENVVLTAPPVPDNFPASKAPKTFADAKGVVIYKSATEEEQQAAWDFIKWVLSNTENDLTWMEMTGLMSARGDLSTNETFTSYFEKNPALKTFAEAIPTAVPPVKSEQYSDLQTQMTEEMMIPLINGAKTPEQAFDDVKAGWEEMLK